jgi:hypothetical protein
MGDPLSMRRRYSTPINQRINRMMMIATITPPMP